jgi:predicted dehydrogenase
MSLRVGVIGCGRIAQAAHLPALARAEGAELVAVCDPSAVLSRGVGRRYDVPSTTDTAELLARDDVDAVLIAVPDRLHLPVTAQALDAGKHVLVEKPLAATVVEAEEIAALAAASGLAVQVGAMKRHDPGIQFAMGAVQGIGRVLTVSAWYRVMSALRPPTEATFFPAMVVDEGVKQHEATFKADRERYLLVTHGAHVFDGLRAVVGNVTSVRADFTRVRDDLTWHSLMRLERGGIASVEITANAHSTWSEGLDVFGEKGHVKVRSKFPFTLQASDVEVFDESTGQVSRPVFGDTNPYERQIEAFAAAAAKGEAPVPDAVDGVEAVRLIEAVAASVAARGESVTP